MADNEQFPANDLAQGRPPSEFPPNAGFPIAFFDAAMSHSSAAGVTKFYLGRFDPNMYGRGGALLNPAVQVVMPTVGFLDMVAFFISRIEAAIERGELKAEDWEGYLRVQKQPQAAANT